MCAALLSPEHSLFWEHHTRVHAPNTPAPWAVAVSSKLSEDFWALSRTTLAKATCQASQSTAYSTIHSWMPLGCGSTQTQKVYYFAPPHLAHVTSPVSISNPSPSHNTILRNIWFKARGVSWTPLCASQHCTI